MQIVSEADSLKCQRLFLGKIRKNYLTMSSADMFTQYASTFF